MTLAERFWDLLGNWSGTEEQSASAWAPAARTRAALTFKLDLGGTAVVQDYRQVRDDGGEFLAHGVFLDDGPTTGPSCGGSSTPSGTRPSPVAAAGPGARWS